MNISPFEVFDQEVDEVIMLINFYISLSNEHKTDNAKTGNVTVTKNGSKRVRVNSATATGGWY